MRHLKLYTFAALLLLMAGMPGREASAQTSATDNVVPAPEPRQSPMALAAARVGDVYVKAVYGSPRMRGRTIFGGLVPHGQVWRTGANEATELTLTGPITFAGEPVDAGTYAVFSIPGPETWTIILNSGLGQWGAYEYDEALDVLRVDVPTGNADASHEAFTIRFDEADAGADMVILWDQTQVRVPMQPR